MTDIINNDINTAIMLSQKLTVSFNKRIYPFTNELLEEYINYFSNKKRMLSVIASGDQIFNAILNGTEEIEAFDINPLVKYYFNLKKAAIIALTREEFIKMFVDWQSFSNQSFYLKNFAKILPHLDANTSKFWSTLMQCFNNDWVKILSSNIWTYALKSNYIYRANAYLGQEGYLKMKTLLLNAKIQIKDGDILELAESYSSSYFDLIYLSNIWNYVNINKYFAKHKSFKLTPNSYLLAYSFGDASYAFEENGYELKPLSKECHSLLVYKKR